jgi:hypothetical protein
MAERGQLITEEFNRHVGEFLDAKAIIDALGMPESTVRNYIRHFLVHRLDPEKGRKRRILPDDGLPNPLTAYQVKGFQPDNSSGVKVSESPHIRLHKSPDEMDKNI